MALAASLPDHKSRTTARPAAGLAEAAKPCKARAKIKTVTLGAKAQAMVARKNKLKPPNRIGRRPKRSDSGPANNCPAAKPKKKTPTTSRGMAEAEIKSAAIISKLGKKVAKRKGPDADKKAKSRIIPILWRCV